MTTLTNKNTSTESTDDLYQCYMCSRQSMRMITEQGTRFAFVNFKLLTQNEEVINYLDSMPAGYLASIGITKGEAMTSKEADPMEALKAQLRKELEAEMAEKAKNEALGIEQDMGNTKPVNDASPLGAITSKGTTAGAAKTK